ncbi:MAG TPA: hypothetical protein VGK16_00140 [Candidatus Limnocylindrales bacterium]|jgi:hypothetical protein
MNRSISATALVLALLGAIACNAPAVTPLPTATAAPVTPSIVTPAALRGTWTAEVRGTSASAGVWKLLISDSNFALQNPIGGDPFTLDPTAVTETSVVFPPGEDCPDQTTVTEGRYSMTLRGNTLTFTLISDSCGDRSATLTTTPWSRGS